MSGERQKTGGANGTSKVNDSIDKHLLVTTAIVDSSSCQTLSLDDVERLKKELQTLNQRIEQSKKKLALETKVRDAALSLSKLYNKKGARRKSILSVSSNDSQGTAISGRTDEELNSSERKCEELIRELWILTTRADEIQKRLLQHCVAILGQTHSGTSEDVPNGGVKGGLYDEMSRASTLGDLDMSRTAIPKHVEDKLSDLSGRMEDLLHSISKAQGIPVQDLGERGLTIEDHINRLESALSFIEDRVTVGSISQKNSADQEKSEALMKTVWDIVVMSDQEHRAHREAQIPEYDDEEEDSEDEAEGDEDLKPFELPSLISKVERLCAHRSRLANDKARLRKKVVEVKRKYDTEMEDLRAHYDQRIDEVSVDLKDMESQLEQVEFQHEEATKRAEKAESELKTLQTELERKETEIRVAAAGTEQQAALTKELQDLQTSVRSKGEELQEARAKMQSMEEELEKAESLAKAKEDDIKQKEDEARSLRDQLEAVNQQLSIIKEQLEAQAEELEEKAQLEEALDEETGAHQQTKQEFTAKMAEKESELEELNIRLNELQESRNMLQAEHDAAMAEHAEQINELEGQVGGLQRSLSEKDAQFTERETALSAELSEKTAKIEQMDNEMRDLEESVAKFSTECAMLKAELDEAYGSRKQRAAEAAQAKAAAEALEAAAKQDPVLLQQIEELQAQNEKLNAELSELRSAREGFLDEIRRLNEEILGLNQQLDRSPPLPSVPVQELKNAEALESRCAMLQSELDGMLADFELLTKQSLEHENERRALEGHIDALRDKVESLEATLAEEKIQRMGTNGGELTPGTPGAPESRSTTVLKNEFKKMMRDMRADQLKALRVSLF